MVSAQCSVIPVLAPGEGRSFEGLRDADGLESLTARGADGEFGCISQSLQPLWTDPPQNYTMLWGFKQGLIFWLIALGFVAASILGLWLLLSTFRTAVGIGQDNLNGRLVFGD